MSSNYRLITQKDAVSNVQVNLSQYERKCEVSNEATGLRENWDLLSLDAHTFSSLPGPKLFQRAIPYVTHAIFPGKYRRTGTTGESSFPITMKPISMSLFLKYL